MATKNKKNSGRPCKYDPKIMPQLAKWMRRSGLTDKEVASEIGIALSTLHVWQGKYPEFSESLKESKNFVDSLVEDCLLKRALGFEYEEVETTTKVTKEGDREISKIRTIKKMVVPDTTAQIFWLKNRQESWREKPDAQNQEEMAEILKSFAERLPV